MKNKVQNILTSSSLSSLLPETEIYDISEEIAADLQDLLDDEIEKEKEEMGEDMDDLRSDIHKLEKENEALLKFKPKNLQDEMAMDWIMENFESLRELYLMLPPGKVEPKALVEMVKIKKPTEWLLAERFYEMEESDWEIYENICETELALEPYDYDHKRIILVGRAASGKDHMRKIFESKGYSYGISFTTRPKRDNEVDGVDYFFISEDQFKAMIERDEFYEYVTFNDWYYGTSRQQFQNDDLFIMTPHGLSKLDPEDRKTSLVMYFDIPSEVRRERLMARNDSDTVERRMKADDDDFAGFTNFDIKITDPTF